MPQSCRQLILGGDDLHNQVVQALTELDGRPHLSPRLQESIGHQLATGLLSLYDHFTIGFGRYGFLSLL